MTSSQNPAQPGAPRGFMVVCDGSNGAGKTTLIQHLRAHLEGLGFEVVVTREPGGTAIGEKIREILLSPDSPEMCDLTELMLFGAARAQHLREKILPALAAGKVVLCDRFDSATISFQHYARGLDLTLVERINALALDGFQPDLYLILDLDPAIGLSRVQQRGETLDRMEAEQLAFLQRARDGYLKQAEQHPRRFRVLDARCDAQQVAAEAIALVNELAQAAHSGLSGELKHWQET
ncbi:dTMP kinase [Achromobacter sp. F4_2707]|uniref:dTMP kinase n=1 Tax=Achromobacter sp. F4_2707 TaxID=3114286 RepID=UPI0039C6B253